MDKKSFRKKCLRKLHKKKGLNKKIADQKIADELKKLIKSLKPRSILFYLPLKIEVDLRSIMNLYRKKYKIFVPFIVKESFKMVKYRLPLTQNAYGIFEPPKSRQRIDEVDMIIVPVVGVDGAFKRVGFGKGMYDRYFQKLKNRPVVVFVQRVKCVTNEIVTDRYDISADFYITPKETLFRGKKYDNSIANRRFRRSSGRRRRRAWSKKIT